MTRKQWRPPAITMSGSSGPEFERDILARAIDADHAAKKEPWVKPAIAMSLPRLVLDRPSFECPTCRGNGRVHDNPWAPPERHDLKPGEQPRPGTSPPIGYIWRFDRHGRATQRKLTRWDLLPVSCVGLLYAMACVLLIFVCGVVAGSRL